MEELRPCVFCGHDEARVIAVDEVTDAGCEEATVPLYAASCPYCGARGPMALSEGEAVEAWNRRAERTCVFRYEEKLGEYDCSSCGERVSGTDPDAEYEVSVLAVLESFEYCPHCGARVIKEES